MAENFYPTSPVRFAEVFDGRLEPLGVREQRCEEADANSRALTDGTNFLWVYRNEDGTCSATRMGGNDAGPILAALSTAFETEWLSENEFDDDGDADGEPRH
jgi:hypothetical protein